MLGNRTQGRVGRMQDGAEGEVEQGLGPVTASINSMGALELENMLKNCPKLGQEAQVLIPLQLPVIEWGCPAAGGQGLSLQ